MKYFMGDLYRKINEGGEPRTTAERELRALLGENGLRLFNRHFPPEQVLTEDEKAREWEKWLAENELQADVELAITATSTKFKEQLLYLGKAVNYLEFCRKSKSIPDNAKFSHVFIYIGDEAQKLASQQEVNTNPNNFGVLATLKALIDLKREEFPEDSDLLAVIEELSDRLDNLKKTTPEQEDKKE